MARCIGNNEFSLRRFEITMGHIDRNALFPFRCQTIEKIGEIDVREPFSFGRFFNCCILVLIDGFRLI